MSTMLNDTIDELKASGAWPPEQAKEEQAGPESVKTDRPVEVTNARKDEEKTPESLRFLAALNAAKDAQKAVDTAVTGEAPTIEEVPEHKPAQEKKEETKKKAEEEKKKRPSPSSSSSERPGGAWTFSLGMEGISEYIRRMRAEGARACADAGHVRQPSSSDESGHICICGMCPAARSTQTASQRAGDEILRSLQVAYTSRRASIDQRADILRRAVATAEKHRPSDWEDVDARIAELKEALAAGSDILLAPSSAALASILDTLDQDASVLHGRVKGFRSKRRARKVVQKMAEQKAVQLIRLRK